MATETERPKAWLPGRKRNPAYDIWRKSQAEGAMASAAPVELTLRAISGARNTNFVRCALGNGDAVHARVRKGAAAKLIGKSIRVLVAEEDGEKKYTHLP